jgi:hypothetical protein
MTAGAQAVLLHLFWVVLKKYSNWGVLMAVKGKLFQTILADWM